MGTETFLQDFSKEKQQQQQQMSMIKFIEI